MTEPAPTPERAADAPTPEALIEMVARSLCEALIGDDIEWRQHRSAAGRLIEALTKHGALDTFAQARVESERERIAKWHDAQMVALRDGPRGHEAITGAHVCAHHDSATTIRAGLSGEWL